MVSKHIILASFAAIVLNALPVFAEERYRGMRKCTSPSSDCDVIPCNQVWGLDPKETCNQKCNWPETRQAACCAYQDKHSDLFCTQQL
ncbi:hypothetical protein BUE80_DR005210 [Diplocarpon rosae]|nr:hypothetical protein BUE80_DR005210 [Diplocarpon rosae]